MTSSFGTVRCVLLDRRSSVPLSGAQVTCVARNGRVRMLDADARGAFTAELPEGVYDLVVSARGYLSLTVRGIGVLADHVQDVTRGLVPGDGGALDDSAPATAVGGTVTDRVGQLMRDVTMHLNSDDGKQSYTTRTDRTGTYLIHGVAPGMYDLTARAGERTLALAHVPIANVRELIRADMRVVHLL